MKRIVKFIFLAVFTLVFVSLSVVAVSALDAVVKKDVSSFAELSNALKNEKSSRVTLVLNEDINVTSYQNTVFQVLAEGEVTLDLNGHSITINSDISNVLFYISSDIDFSVINSSKNSAEISFNTLASGTTYMFWFDNTSSEFSCYGNVFIRMNTVSGYEEVGDDKNYVFYIEYLGKFELNGCSVISSSYNPILVSAINSGAKISEFNIIGDTKLATQSYTSTDSVVEINSHIIQQIDFKSMSIEPASVNDVSLNDIFTGSKPYDYFNGLSLNDFKSFSFGNVKAENVFKNNYIYKNVVIKGKIETVYNCSHSKSVEKVYTASGHLSFCTSCGKYIAIKAHKESVFIAAVAPTCTKSGLSASKGCSNSSCGYVITKQQTIDAKGHTVVTDPAKSATCTGSGLTKGKHCSVCSAVITKQTKTDPLGHDLDKSTTTKVSPTCTKQGSESTTCKRCKKSIKTTINALGHSYTQKIIDKAHMVSAPCYTKGGVYYYDCSRCSKIGTKTFTADNKLKLGKPKSLTATQTLNSISLQWLEVKDATGYDVYQKIKSKWTKIASVKTKSLTVPDLKTATVYEFYVVAYVKENGKTVWAESNTKLLTSTKPKAPSKISATQTKSSVKLTWSSSSGATGYRVYKYNESSKKYETITTLNNVKTYNVTKLQSATVYRFKVKAYIKLSNGKIVWGDTGERFETATAPDVPTLTVSSTAKGTVKLTWTNVKRESGYQLYYSTSKNGTYKRYNTYEVDTKSRTIKKLTSGTTYYFKVRAIKKVGNKTICGGFSEIKKVKVK